MGDVLIAIELCFEFYKIPETLLKYRIFVIFVSTEVLDVLVDNVNRFFQKACVVVREPRFVTPASLPYRRSRYIRFRFCFVFRFPHNFQLWVSNDTFFCRDIKTNVRVLHKGLDFSDGMPSGFVDVFGHFSRFFIRHADDGVDPRQQFMGTNPPIEEFIKVNFSALVNIEDVEARVPLGERVALG